MRHTDIRARIASLLVACAVGAVAPAALLGQLEVPTRGIDHHNRLLLVRAKATGKTDGIVLLATRLGATDSVLRAVEALGGRVRTRFDDVGYARVRLPLAQFARVRALPGVIATRIEGGQFYANDQGTDPAAMKLLGRLGPKPDSARHPTLPPLPAAALAAESPYVPIATLGVHRLRAAHPTFDGRGVTIAVLEGGTLDFLHPSLQGAKQLTGDSVAKIRGVIDPALYESADAADALASDRTALLTADTVPDRGTVRRTGVIDASDGTFMLEGHMYHAPHPGRFSVGMYHGGPRRGPTVDYGVAWDEARGLVWVDANRNFDLRDETPLTDINRKFSAGWLHRDSTAAHPQSSVSFAVAFDSADGGVRVYEGTQFHQTMVAGSAAGEHVLGGAATGMAPAAQVVIVDADGGLGSEIEAFVRAERDPRVDVITCSQPMETFPGSGESILSLVLTRAIARYQKPVFVAAGNSGPLMTVTGDVDATEGVISVGASIERATYQVDFGWDVTDAGALIPYSSRGPSGAGALKPDLVAPALLLTAQPCSMPPRPQGPTLYAIPKCYMLGGGTSNATPTAAGAAAVLMSAAKQQHRPYDAVHIAWAMRMGARPMAGYAVHEQGHGLVDVVHAWDLLQRAPAELPVIETEAPVHTALARYLHTPGHGVGLYEREGWAAGDTGTRIVTLTRRTGPTGAVRYRLQWSGNDGTFSAPTVVTLPRGTPVEVPVHLAPRSSGVHSAALDVLDPSTGVPVHSVLATVIAAEPFTPATGYTVHAVQHVLWPRSTSVFVNVPPGAEMMRVTLHVGRGRYKLRTEDSESGDNLESLSYFKGYRYPAEGMTFVTAGQSGVELFPHPRSGVWELLVEPFDRPETGGDSAQYHVPGDVELTATVVGVDASNLPHSSAQGGELTWVNRFASIDHAAVQAQLGTRRTEHVVVDSAAGPTTFDLQVAPGTTMLRVEATPTADSTADVDLYLYDCTGERCYLWDDDHGVSATKALLVRAPSPGTWKVVLDPARVPGGTTPVTYVAVLTNPAYGTVEVDSSAAPRRPGEQWATHLVAHKTGSPSDGAERVIVAEVVDSTAEAAERAHPLATFAGPPYRPAAAGAGVIPF